MVIGTLNWNSSLPKFSEFKYYFVERRPLEFDDIIKYDPISRYSLLSHLPQLMLLNGILDTMMPILSVCEAYEKMRSIYVRACCEYKIGLLKYKKSCHKFTAEMMKDIVKVLKEEL